MAALAFPRTLTVKAEPIRQRPRIVARNRQGVAVTGRSM